MNITLIMVQSVDGKITQGQSSYHDGWTSKEDLSYFQDVVAKQRLIVMGKHTYESFKDKIVLSPHIRRIVMTRNPTAYSAAAVPGQLEFTRETPSELVTRLESMGYTHMLLVGGSHVNNAFLAEKLITECLISIEPTFLGQGKSLFTSLHRNVQLTLRDTKKLNKRGTMVLHYSVSYER